MFPIFGALQIILLLNRMSNAQSLEALVRKRPMIHITAQALEPPTFKIEISPLGWWKDRQSLGPSNLNGSQRSDVG